MRDALLKVADALGSFVADLGFKGFVLLVAALVLASLTLGFLDRVATILGRFEHRWSRWSRSTRWSLAVLALFACWPVIKVLIPWRSAFLAVLCGGLVVLSVGGYVYGERYGVHDSPWAAWAYHARVTVRKRRFGKAIDSSTGKKKNRAVSMRLAPNGDDIIAHPGEGISAHDLAEQFNNGVHTSALKNQFGLDVVKTVSAAERPDGSVSVRIGHEVAADDPFFATVQHWPGAEAS